MKPLSAFLNEVFYGHSRGDRGVFEIYKNATSQEITIDIMQKAHDNARVVYEPISGKWFAWPASQMTHLDFAKRMKYIPSKAFVGFEIRGTEGNRGAIITLYSAKQYSFMLKTAVYPPGRDHKKDALSLPFMQNMKFSDIDFLKGLN